MKLQWSMLALHDRNQIFDYIEQCNPSAAIGVDERIGSQIERLSHYPESGRLGRIAGTRELVIAHTPYIAAYRVLGDVVLVLRVLHGSQHWPDDV